MTPDGEDEGEETFTKAVKKRKAASEKSSIILLEDQVDILPPEAVVDDFVYQAMQNAYDPNTNTVRDLKVDDSDLPFAKNYYDFCANLAGTNIKMPFARQLWMGVHLMGEVCPRCTHPNAFIMEKIPVDLDPHVLASKMVLLEFGRCPKCKVSKGELILKKELKDYVELVLVGGQRLGKCGSADTIVLTQDGPRYLGSFFEKDTPEGFSDYPDSLPDLALEKGQRARPTKLYKERPLKLIQLDFSNNVRLKCTDNHPLWNGYEYVKASEIQVGDSFPIRVGQNSWSSSYVSLSRFHKMTETQFSSRMKTARKYSLDRDRLDLPEGYLTENIARLLGYYVSEGNSPGRGQAFCITNTDQNILKDCRRTISDLFGSPYVKYRIPKDSDTPVGLVVRHPRVSIFVDAMLGGQFGKKSAGVFVPPAIMQSPRPVVAAFLSALFEGDGGLDGGRVCYSSLSERLVREVQQLLFNFGIYCGIGNKWTWAANGSENQVSKLGWGLGITSLVHLKRFRDLIGFQSERKKAELQQSIDQKENNTKRNPFKGDHLPPFMMQEWRQLKDEAFEATRDVFVLDSWGRKKHVRIRDAFKGTKPSRGNMPLTRRCIEASLNAQAELAIHLPKDLRTRVEKFILTALNNDIIWVKVKSKTRMEKAEPSYDFNVPKYHRFVGNGLVNHNSTFTATLVAYVVHKMLKSPRLSSIAQGIQAFTPLTGSFVALSTTKSIKLLWNPVRDMISVSVWFQDYFKMLDYYGKKYGKELYQFSATGTYLRVFTKGLDMYPEGPSKRTLRGPTRFIAATDELGHFPYNLEQVDENGDEIEDERERANGDEVHQVLTNSLATVRTEVLNLYSKGFNTLPQGLNLSISSPASHKDKIMRLYKESQDSDIVLGVKAATWEVSPLYTRDHPIIADMYKRNPRKAERDFGANPPELESSIFNRDQIRDNFCVQPLFSVQYDHSHPERTRATLVELHKPNSFAPSILSLDAGLTDNAFSLCLSQQSRGDTRVTAKSVLEVVPQPGKQIDFVFLYQNLIRKIIKTCNVKAVFADRWNSIHILQSIETEFPDVIAKQVTLKTRDFDAFIQFQNAGLLELPVLELEPERIEAVTNYKTELLRFPASHLYRQFLTVQYIGGTLYKGSGSTDDIFRSVVLGVVKHLDPKIREHLDKFKDTSREELKPEQFILVSGRSTMNPWMQRR